MFPALGLGLALMLPGAPIPKDVVPSGPAPYILNLKAENDGKIRFTVQRTEKVKVSTTTYQGGPNGQAVPIQVEREVTVTKYERVELPDLKGLKVYTPDGKEVEIKDAAKKLTESTLAIASSNGQKVDPAFLKLFKDDVLILVSSDLTPSPHGISSPGFGTNVGTLPPAGIQLFPVPPIGVAPPLPPPPPLPAAPKPPEEKKD